MSPAAFWTDLNMDAKEIGQEFLKIENIYEEWHLSVTERKRWAFHKLWRKIQQAWLSSAV